MNWPRLLAGGVVAGVVIGTADAAIAGAWIYREEAPAAGEATPGPAVAA